MATTLPVSIRENDKIVAKLDDWDDAHIIAQRWSNNRPNNTYTVQHDDGMTLTRLTAKAGLVSIEDGLPTRKRKR